MTSAICRVPLSEILPHVHEATPIRVDVASGRASVHDLISSTCSNKNAREAFSSLARMHSAELKRLGVEGRPLSGRAGQLTPTIALPNLPRFLEICLASARIPLQRKFLLLGREQQLPLRSFAEVELCHKIAVVFTHLQPELQKPVQGYRVDLHLHAPRVALECDENSHKSYGLQAELQREQRITAALDCLMVRFDPYDPAFSYEKLLHRILLAVDMQMPRALQPIPDAMNSDSD